VQVTYRRFNENTGSGIDEIRQEAALTETRSYRIIYSGILEVFGNARIYLISLVGAARFELATPCAQGSLQRAPKVPYFQLLTFQAVAGSLLNLVGPY